MWSRFLALSCIIIGVSLLSAMPDRSEAASVSVLIENFVQKQFPGANSHLWIVNGTQWQNEDELVVDLNAIVTRQLGQAPTTDRFLLLIIHGRVAASQNIPLGSTTECQPEAM